MGIRIYGNRQIKTLPGLATRPTPSRVRQAVFNIWQGTIRDCRWLDLCAGSGAMGAEALCRGAAVAIAIDQSAAACRVVQQNWSHVAQPHQHIQVRRGSVLSQLASLTAAFDRIYFDPPYHSDLYQPVLEAIAQRSVLAPGGELAAEHDPHVTLPQQIPAPTGTLVARRYKQYGNTALTFYGWQDQNYQDKPH
jgi:16S rRNA (guanine966-N2)-methyltransferase